MSADWDGDQWERERDRVHDALAAALRDLNGGMLVASVTVVVTVNSDGEKQLSCFTSPDQRQWETIGLLEYVRMDHGAYLAQRRMEGEE
ncbi:hypothetical protein [Streptomyces sp. NPDC047097]|uniref:hypothetical protein n=1 Tax=Streptomyces sp. NPDC047097 TaxID=3155260 RepID=UPI0033C905B1